MSSCWCHTITKYHAYDEPKWQTTTGHTWRVSRCCGGNVCDYDALGPHERMNIHLKWKPITEHRWEVLDFISMCCCIFYFNFQKILRIIVSSWHQVISCVHANHVHHQTYTQESAFKYCLCTCCDAETKKKLSYKWRRNDVPTILFINEPFHCASLTNAFKIFDFKHEKIAHDKSVL